MKTTLHTEWTWTSLNVLLTLTWLLAFWCITCTICTSYSGIRTFYKAHHSTFPGALSKTFSRSTKTKNRFRFFLMFASRTYLTIKIVPVVPCPGMNPYCISSILTILWMEFSMIHSMTFRISSISFKPQ